VDSIQSIGCAHPSVESRGIDDDMSALSQHSTDYDKEGRGGGLDNDNRGPNSEGHPESGSVGSVSTLGPLPIDLLRQASQAELQDLPESARQNEATFNKLMAVDEKFHKSAWLFHLIDRNSDASLTLDEFVLALAEQPLVSMALNLPQQMAAEGSREKVELVFDRMDWNGSGTINMQKFLSYVDSLRRRESLRRLRSIQHQIDVIKKRGEMVDSRPPSAKESDAFQVNIAVSMTGSRRLNLSFRSLGDEEVKPIAENLKSNTMLRFFSLGRNKIGSEGITCLAESLRVNSTLTRLDLGSNIFNNEGVIIIADALRENSSLQRLDLYNTPMDESGARAVAVAITCNKTLQELNLRGNHMGNEGAELIGNSLRYNTTLTRLFLQENDIDPIPGMRGFVRSLYSVDDFVLEKVEGIDLPAFSRILDIAPDPLLTNDKVLAIMRSRRGLHISKQIVNK